MAATHKFDKDKAIAAALLVLTNKERTCDLHKLFKILYFAEQKHLARYGRPIFGDTYIAMKNGPVPSSIYDILKMVKEDSVYFDHKVSVELRHFFTVENYNVKMNLVEPNMEIFSESEIECIMESLEENKLLSFGTLTDKSHDLAWNNASYNDKMSAMDIAKAGGANDEMLKYIRINIENDQLVF